MKHIVWTNLDAPARKTALARPAAISNAALIEGVRAILRDVQDNGDEALSRLTKKFDGRAPDTVEIPISTLEAAWNALPASDQAVIERARRAKVAGVRNRIVVTPPGKDGTVNSVILAAAYRCKVSRLFVVGGAQAIGALAYGTNTIPKCDKIFGPGNAWVAAAKSLVAQEAGGPAIDMPAGPSEAMVLADEAADPAFVASDLLSQAEHDTVAQVVCVASTAEMADRIEKEIEAQLKTLPREAIAREALKHGRMIIANERMDIIDIVNRYAPEHLIVQLRDPDTYVGAIRNAGSIFLGPWTPESVGDYASGTNHTLPTYGAARAYSGVTLESFIKYVSIQKLTKKGLKRLGPVVERLAEMEGLDAHKRAVSLRLEALQ